MNANDYDILVNQRASFNGADADFLTGLAGGTASVPTFAAVLAVAAAQG